MRLIDADALKAAIKIEWDMVQGESKHEQSVRGGIRKAVRCMEKTPTLDYAPTQQWISVKDRLPEDGVDVIVCTNRNGRTVEFAYYRYQRKAWFRSCILLIPDVLYWMPLPEPPKEE